MYKDIIDFNDFYYQPSKFYFKAPPRECLKKELEQLNFQCNLKLLQKKIIMLFGYPSIKVESERIHTYLQGIYYQSEFEQLKKLKVLISFMGEVSQINDWNERGQIIQQRVLSFLNIQGLEVRWSDQQWQNEIDSIVTLRSINPYYDTIPNKIFSYVDLFNILGIQLPTELKHLQHQSFNQIQTSNLIDDFHLLCNIDEFHFVRNIRIFIQQITDKLYEFMNLIINIETMHSVEIQSITNHYQTLCHQLQHILISFIPNYETKHYQKQQLIIDEYPQEITQQQQLKYKKIISTVSFTTIIQRPIESKINKSKNKIKQKDQLNFRSSLLYQIEKSDSSFDQDQIKQSQNSSQIYDSQNSNDLISQLQHQLLNNVGIEIFKNQQCSLENLNSKILTYQYIQYKLQQLGYPCINLNENELISILQEYKLDHQDKKTLVVKLVNILSESFRNQNYCLDITKQIRDLTLKYLSQISIEYPIQELNKILNEQCIPKAIMQDYENLSLQKFSYEKLSQILNRKFPQQVYQIKCSSTNLIFQQWNIQQLLDIFNFYDLQNIRVIRSYINQVCTCLQELINFKEIQQLNIDVNVIQEFMSIEKQFLDIINQPLNFLINSQYYQSSNLSNLDNNQNNEQQKQQILQTQDLDIIKEVQKYQKQEEEQMYGLYIEQQNQDKFSILNLNQPNIPYHFNFLYSHNQSDSPRFSFINKSQQQSDDQQQNSAEEQFLS